MWCIESHDLYRLDQGENQKAIKAGLNWLKGDFRSYVPDQHSLNLRFSQTSPIITMPVPGRAQRPTDDPLDEVLRPPPDETLEQRESRLAREEQASQISLAIDADIKAERQARRKKRIVRLLLLGQSESGEHQLYFPLYVQTRLIITQANPPPSGVSFSNTPFELFTEPSCRISAAVYPDSIPGGAYTMARGYSAKHRSFDTNDSGYPYFHNITSVATNIALFLPSVSGSQYITASLSAVRHSTSTLVRFLES